MTKNPLADTVILSVSTRRPSAKRKAARGTVEVRGAVDGDDPDQDSASVSIDILRCKAFLAIVNADNAMRARLKAESLPAGRHIAPGCYLIPVAQAEDLMAYLDQRAAEREQQIAAFVDAYPEAVLDAWERLGDAFVPSMFPGCVMVDGRPFVSPSGAEAIRAGFSMEYHLEMADREAGILAAGRAGLSRAFVQRELAKAREAGEAMLAEVRDGLRVAFATLIDNAIEALRPAADGERKVFRAEHLAKINAFIDTFAVRNVTGDGDLAAIVERARAVVRGVSAEDLRDARDRSARERFGEALQIIAAEMKPIVAPKRKITLTEEGV